MAQFLVFTSLNAATAVPTIGEVLVLDEPKTMVSMQKNATNATAFCSLQGSLDGVNFFTLTRAVNGPSEFVFTGPSPVIALRATLDSFTSLGAGASVTALIGVA